ncbi:hypothetical protein ACIRL2_32670 [Embleya sp. NPDC127516]|uniref:hypothetical protein n=1 Tax=Embleya sp. NPDC127516 TaxID=3363990 RepID=UPI00381CF86C
MDDIEMVLVDEAWVAGVDLTASLGGEATHPETAREYVEGLLRCIEDFPDSGLRVVAIEDISESFGNAYAIADDEKITFDSNWAGVDNRDILLGTLRHDVENGWESQDVPANPIAIATHEFGHILQADAEARKNGGRGVKGSDLISKIGRNARRTRNNTSTIEVGRVLGKYALKFLEGEEYELGARAFEVVRLSTGRPHEVALDAYGELMNDLDRPWHGSGTGRRSNLRERAGDFAREWGGRIADRTGAGRVGARVMDSLRGASRATAGLVHRFRNLTRVFKPRPAVSNAYLNDSRMPLPDIIRWAAPTTVAGLKPEKSNPIRAQDPVTGSLGFVPASRVMTNQRASADRILQNPIHSAFMATGAGVHKSLEKG